MRFAVGLFWFLVEVEFEVLCSGGDGGGGVVVPRRQVERCQDAAIYAAAVQFILVDVSYCRTVRKLDMMESNLTTKNR